MSAKAQAKTQAKTPAAPAAAYISQPLVAEPEHEAERPDIAAQLEGAARLGHSLGEVNVDNSAPPTIQRQEIPEEEEEELQLKREPAAVQRQELPEEEEELMLKRGDQRVGPQGGPVPPEVEAAIQRARGGGQPLEGALQQQMSASLGHDFSRVRVHIDAEADELNQQLQAKAFTTGPDIFFKRGAYDPGSGSGRELISHELGHVVQQSTGRVAGAGDRMTVRPAGDAFEQEADGISDAVSRAINTSVEQQTPDDVELQMHEEEEAIQTHITVSPSVTGARDLGRGITSDDGGGYLYGDAIRKPLVSPSQADFSDVRVHAGSAEGETRPSEPHAPSSAARERRIPRGEPEPGLLGRGGARVRPMVAVSADVLSGARVSAIEAAARARVTKPPEAHEGGCIAPEPGRRLVVQRQRLVVESGDSPRYVAQKGDLLLGYAHTRSGRAIIGPFGGATKGLRTFSHAAIMGPGGKIYEMQSKSGFTVTPAKEDIQTKGGVHWVYQKPPKLDYEYIAIALGWASSAVYDSAGAKAALFNKAVAVGTKLPSNWKEFYCVSLVHSVYQTAWFLQHGKELTTLKRFMHVNDLATWAEGAGFTEKGLAKWVMEEEKEASE